MPATHAPRCRRCTAKILWATTESGRLMPLDPEPDEQGTVAAARDGTGRLRVRVLSKERPTLEHHEARYVPHFATCPSWTKRTRS